MPPKPRPVTAKSLQHLLTQIGSPSSGTKDVLLQRLKCELGHSRLFARRAHWQDRLRSEPPRGLRMVSIDMGIKNLAFCEVDVDYSGGDATKPMMNVIKWDKLNLADATQQSHLSAPNAKNTISPTFLHTQQLQGVKNILSKQKASQAGLEPAAFGCD